MSVINQMLRDLDARQASQQERDKLPGKLRNLPPARVAKSNAWWLLIVGMVAGGALAWVFVSQLAAPPPPLALAAPVAAVAPAPVAPAPAPDVVPADEATREVAPPTAVGDMKIDTLLTRPAEEAAKVPTPPADSAPVKAIATTTQEPRNTPVPSVAPRVVSPLVEAASPATSIDKKAKIGPAIGPVREMAEAEYRKALQSVKYGENAAAAQSLRHTLDLDPALAKARQALLAVLVNGKQWAEAQQVVQKGLELEPTQSGWALILARLQFELGNTPLAIETLEHYAAHAGTDADYQGFFAYLLQKQERPGEAAERFRAALALRPQEGRWWFGLGLALEGAGKRPEAKEAYAKAREVGNLPPDMAQVIEQRLR